MDVLLEFSLESVENEDHLSEPIATCAGIFDDAGLEYEVGAAGTTVQGELETVLECIAECHETIGADGQRVKSVLQIDAREDWPPGSIQRQAEKVEEELAGAQPV